jgi:hypothetical protein
MLTELEYAQQLRKWRLRRDPAAEDRPFCPNRGSVRRPLPPDTESRLRELWASGMTLEDIARAMGRNPCTIGTWKRKLQLPDRHIRPSTTLWPPVDDAFVLEWYGSPKKGPRWIAHNLPSGRSVTHHAVIGRYHRLQKRKTRTQAERQQVIAATSG